jgi:hypothetical protein
MAVVLLGANNTGDISQTAINIAPNTTSSGNLSITTSGVVSYVKLKMSQNSAIQSNGGHSFELTNAAHAVIATGTFNALGTVPKGDPAAWYTINLTGSPSVIINDIVHLIASKDVGSGIVLQWRNSSTFPYMLEVWGEELALPTKAKTPAPANDAANVTLDQATITWVDGGGADTYNVYYGDTSGSLPLMSSAQAGTSLTVTGITLGSPYSYLITRYWRIDSTNDGGTTTGDEWSFTTIRFSAPTVTYFYPTTGQYYQLLIQFDGSYGDVPGVGVEDTDYVFLAAGYEPNFIKTTRKLVSVANSKVWYEDI